MGEDKVILGSDYPFPLGEHHPGKLIMNTDISETVKRDTLFYNALKFLDLDSKDYL